MLGGSFHLTGLGLLILPLVCARAQLSWRLQAFVFFFLRLFPLPDFLSLLSFAVF